MKEEKQFLDFKNLSILAPMVRISKLPFRVQCLRNGADLVYSEELVDRKVIECDRIVNSQFDTIEYISRKDRSLVFSTHREEKGKLVLQLGTGNSAYALQAALKVIEDVDGIDINMGCPKKFSVNNGMGAFLLNHPDIASDILKTLKRNLLCPITCKIRLFEDLQDTINFGKLCEFCGISAIAIHARKPSERPNTRAHWDVFPSILSAISIPIIANGDLFTREDISFFKEHVDAHSLMFARGAIINPQIFSSNGVPNVIDSCKTFIKTCIEFGEQFSKMKFVLLKLLSMGGNGQLHQYVTTSKSYFEIRKIFDFDECSLQLKKT